MLRTEAVFLASPEGQALLDAARETRPLPAHARGPALRQQGTPEQVRCALAQDDLRQRAKVRIAPAEKLLFTAEALEQASAWPVACERAGRWHTGLDQRLVDLGAGLGIDALAVALTGRPVLAVERDPARAVLLGHNARALGVEPSIEVLEADLAGAPPGPLAYLDPDRRAGGQRTRSAALSEPPRAQWRSLLSRYGSALVKAAPTDHSLLGYGAPLELVSLEGAARETRIYLGEWEGLPARRALALPSGAFVEGVGAPWPSPVDAQPGQWLLDPDTAVIHAELVGDLAEQQGLAPLGTRIAYLLGPNRMAGCPGHWMHIQALLKPSTVNAWLAAQEVGRVTIRKRGVPWRAQDFRGTLRLAGSRAATLVLTSNLSGRRVVLAGLDVEPGAS